MSDDDIPADQTDDSSTTNNTETAADGGAVETEAPESRFWGVVPPAWELVDGTDIYDVNPSYAPEEEEITYIEMGALDTELPFPKYTKKRKAADYSGKLFCEGDSLFARITPCTENGKAAFVDDMETDIGIGSTEYAVLSPDRERIHPLYLYYLAKSHPVRNYAISRMRGSTGRQRVPFSVFRKELDVSLPPLSEQRKIASILYTVDEGIQKTDQITRKLKRVNRGIRQDILSFGVNEEGELRTSSEEVTEGRKETEWDTVPNSWQVKELSSVCSLQVGYAFKSKWYKDEGNVRVLRGANVGYGEPDWSETRYLEEDRVPEYEEYRLKEGDMIIGMDRPLTNSGFKLSTISDEDIPSLLVQRVGRFRPEGCDSNYLNVVLNDWRYQKQVIRRGQGMDIPHISKSDILAPKVPIPSEAEQKRIAQIYATQQEKVEKERELLNEFKCLKQGLMHDLLQGDVRTDSISLEICSKVSSHE